MLAWIVLEVMIMKHYSSSVILLATLALLPASCSKRDTTSDTSEPGTAPQAGATSQETDKSEDATADDALGQKLNAYIGCTNHFSRDVARLRHNYLSYIKDPKVGPVPKQRRSYTGAWTMVDPKGRCVDPIAKANAIKPTMPELERAATAYGAALMSLVPLYQQASDYYQSKNYKDDGYKGGASLHPKLVAAWDAFGAADKRLREITLRKSDERQARELQRLEKQHGRTLPFLTRNMLAQAKALVRVGSVRDYEDVQLQPFREHITKYEAAAKELRDYAAAHKEEANKVMMLNMVIARSQGFLTASKELMRRKRDGKKYSTGEKATIRANNARAVRGHPAQVVAKYNELIDMSNRIAFR